MHGKDTDKVRIRLCMDMTRKCSRVNESHDMGLGLHIDGSLYERHKVGVKVFRVSCSVAHNQTPPIEAFFTTAISSEIRKLGRQISLLSVQVT